MFSSFLNSLNVQTPSQSRATTSSSSTHQPPRSSPPPIQQYYTPSAPPPLPPPSLPPPLLPLPFKNNSILKQKWKNMVSNGKVPAYVVLKTKHSNSFWRHYTEEMLEAHTKYKLIRIRLAKMYRGITVVEYGDYTHLYFTRYLNAVQFMLGLEKFINTTFSKSFYFSVSVAIAIGGEIEKTKGEYHGINVLSAISQVEINALSFSTYSGSQLDYIDEQLALNVRELVRNKSDKVFEKYCFEPTAIDNNDMRYLNKYCKYQISRLLNSEPQSSLPSSRSPPVLIGYRG
jgi:hypothetical protein